MLSLMDPFQVFSAANSGLAQSVTAATTSISLFIACPPLMEDNNQSHESIPNEARRDQKGLRASADAEAAAVARDLMCVAGTRPHHAVVLVAPAGKLVHPVAVAADFQAAEWHQERHVVAVAVGHASAEIDVRLLAGP